MAPRVLRRLTPDHVKRLELVRGDKKYRNNAIDRWMREEQVTYRVEVINGPKDAEGFVLLPKRWVVERSFAWLGRYRRQSQDLGMAVVDERGDDQDPCNLWDSQTTRSECGQDDPVQMPENPEVIYQIAYDSAVVRGISRKDILPRRVNFR